MSVSVRLLTMPLPFTAQKIGNKAVGYIEYNRERDACNVVIDGKPYTWAELERNIRAHEGWKIKIEFGDVGDELD